MSDAVRADAGLRARAAARLTDAGFAAGWGAVKRLPEPMARAAFDGAGRWAAGREGRGVRQLRANLRVATGGRLSGAELDALTDRAVRSYARYWQEAFRLPVMEPRRIVDGTVTTGQEPVDRLRDQRRPIVFALPHSGNWDAAAVWLVDWLGGPFMTVAERLEPESLYERFVAYRESLGIRVVPLTGGPRPSSEVLKEWVTGGGTVCLLVDRDLGRTGAPVSFFGRPATLPTGPALLAAQTGAALVPVVCSFTDSGWAVRFFPEVAVQGPGRLRDRVAAAMQDVADAFTAGIADRPEDWHMLGRIWADVPPDPVPGPPGPPGPPGSAGEPG
jgi:lauroyl/myristoyl acyltransferase